VLTEARVIPLTSLEVDASARFLDADLDAEARDLLRALGLTGGTELRVCQQGEPCIVSVRATRIGIANRVARAIRVAPIAKPGA
jgi:Fe2+ transport system protein FeoA